MESPQHAGSSGWSRHPDAHGREKADAEAGAAAALHPDTLSPRPDTDLNFINAPSSNSSMTTKELQEYWKNEKCHCKPVKLLFEISSTRIAKKYSSKYVMYKIIVIQTGSFDSNKAILERRYSDFEVLHKNLLKNFSEEIEDIIFPKKYLTGNFTEEMISERKLAFKEYLSLLYSIKCVRRSREFIDFLTRAELKEAYGCLRAGQYVKALDIFIQVVPLQEKLTRHCPSLVVPSLCAMLVCHRDLEHPAEAFEVGEKVLQLPMHSSHKYYVPFLEAMIHLAYMLGKDFVSLQEKLEESQLQKAPARGITLKELSVREYLH
ncbi:sorting nexin-20 [Sminthopsis crassicaudata]|uniref:sorting nexin-20 n=1 Tax=Sminthopsis crassicaudata TaxID=9301 RepID=UPI003D684EBE